MKNTLVWKGNTAIVNAGEIELVYTLKSVKGLNTKTLYNEKGEITKGGFLTKTEASDYLCEFLNAGLIAQEKKS